MYTGIRNKFWPLNLRFFAAQDENGGGSPTPGNDATGGEGTGNQAGDEGQQNDKSGTAGEGDTDPDPADEKKFSQRDLDRIINERLARANKGGDADPKNAPDIQTIVTQAVTKAVGEVTEKANARTVRAEIKALGAELGFIEPGLLPAILAQDKADLSAVTVGEDGEVDTSTLRPLLEKLAEQRPFLIGDTAGDVIPGAGRTSTGSTTDLTGLTPQQLLARGVEEAAKKKK